MISKEDVSLHENLAGEFVVQGLFSIEVVRIYEQGKIKKKLFLTDLVGQCRNILPIAFSVFTDHINFR